MYYKSIFFNIHLGIDRYDVLPVSCLGAALILAAFSGLLSRKIRMSAILVIDLAVSALMVADIIYYRYYSDVFSTPVFLQAGMADPALKSSVASLFSIKDLVFFADLVILAPVLLYFILKRQFAAYPVKRRLAAAAVLLLAGTGMVASGLSDLERKMGDQSLRAIYDHVFFISHIGTLNYHALDTYFYITDKIFTNKGVSTEERDHLKKELANNRNADGEHRLSGIGKGKNLIVIQVESMQNLVINLKIGGREVTPNLNGFIRNSIYFNRYFSQTGQGNTADAEFISNNSFYPLPEGAVYFRSVGNTFASLPKALKQQGYGTMALHAYKASFWNRATIYPGMGFDRFISKKDFVNDDCVGWWGLMDKSFLRQSAGIMEKARQPFYSFIVTLSSHYPFDTFKDSNDFDAGEYSGTLFGNYLKAMHYVDESLGSFLTQLKKDGLMDSSIIAMYGDHHALKREDLALIKNTMGLKENDDLNMLEMSRVPLIIHIPGDREAGTINTAGGQIDLFPTVANIMGFTPAYFLGKDLLNVKTGYAVFRDGSVTDGKTVFIKKDNKCYDLQSGIMTDTNSFNEYIKMARQQLGISDSVISNDLLGYFDGNTR